MSYGGNENHRNGSGRGEAPVMAQGGMELLDRPSFTESQARGEVDTQIATAKRFPRSIRQFKERALSLATLDEETASSCFYALPRDGKTIEGPSARLAEIVAASWGNLRATANIVDDDGQFITARGTCWDLENNVAMSTEVRRRVTTKNGARYSADMVNTTSNAACSIALRNAVFKVVPMAIVRPVYLAAKQIAVGDATTLVKRRTDMVAYFGKMGVRPEQVLAAVEKASLEDITVDDLAVLKGLITAIKEGDTTVDEAFPPIAKPDKKEAPKSASDNLAATIGAGSKQPTETKSESKTDAKSETLPDVEIIRQKIEAAMTPETLFDIEKEIGKIADDDTRTGLYLLSSDRRKKLPGA